MLTNSELKYIKKRLGRDPNPLEYGMLDVMFSEHCSYKSSRPVIKMFPTEGDKVIVGPGDDAGVIEINKKFALAVGIESHNHPSAIEPYSGAGTGIGGILRDIISMGAWPIALLDSLHFGHLEDQRSCYLFENVVKGISDYGNRVGVPTVAGEVEFDENFKLNPLVNVMCIGIVPKKKIKRGIAPNVGDVFFLMGGLTGRDGIHGVTFASEELTSESEIEDRPAVQIGDPFTKKIVMEASFEIMEKIPVSGVKDLGGGGLTCCISEMVAKCNNGAEVYVDKVPLREKNMTPYEIMLSESQERMMFVMPPKYVEKALKICKKHEIPAAAVVGKVTDTGRLVVKKNNKIIADIPADLLANPPVVYRESKKPKKIKTKIPDVEHPHPEEALKKVLSSQNIADKSWVYYQYDYDVQIRTIVKPGDDAAVLRIDDKTAIAATVDSNCAHTKLSPYHGGAGSVAEAIRNVVSMGAWPICIVDCLNFGNPEKPEIFWQFKECVKGMAKVAKEFKVPVISGNVSFYNETEGIAVNPSPVVGVVGKVPINNIRTLEFKNKGDKIIMVSKTYKELGGSEYYKVVHGISSGIVPKVRIQDEIAAAKSIYNLVSKDNENKITAIHDCSKGGLAIALSEMAIRSGIGAKIDLDLVPKSENIDKIETLFSESHGRYIMTVDKSVANDFIKEINVPAKIIGKVTSKKLKINDIINISVKELQESYYGVIENFVV
ncbi:phosphoribosylformylglycinamidine synthase subunit II [Methanothermus fervidus DSM 2088]|uniref:Phosphoribosylformylglycinamidine synthase subunit PurL n=1 Tax=Methanothermus fervidus (strain ATCC 43054 / DSM 2088 / JCM 10308 / V24 S) TaxID=523846 RepID=E3GWE6_METFV|nr:phosphoribosylformylglycinamidine synthase subunit PurL [Methanothermus fervidus]ADP77911.1 phosphoribosylformylglycinamidine synthase subunit II [Methanothermus fervidus DSM 2088]